MTKFIPPTKLLAAGTRKNLGSKGRQGTYSSSRRSIPGVVSPGGSLSNERMLAVDATQVVLLVYQLD